MLSKRVTFPIDFFTFVDGFVGRRAPCHAQLAIEITNISNRFVTCFEGFFDAQGTILELLGRSGPPLEHHRGTEGHPRRLFTDSGSILEANVFPKASSSDPPNRTKSNQMQHYLTKSRCALTCFVHLLM